ncbi:MAG: hypothetical protein H8E83_05125 [Planctomycetes bacterium]|nr:hypothetical protein [Planctomycetota bacterium]
MKIDKSLYMFFLLTSASCFASVDVLIQDAQLLGSPTVSGDSLAFSVAASGQTVVLGAPLRNHVGNGYDSGALYVYDRVGTGWAQTINIAASDGAAFDYLGWAVDIEGDVIAAGASWANETGIKSGGVYMFRRTKTWAQEALIVPSDLPAEANFGHAVDLDEQSLIVGAPYIDEDVNAKGVAYIFRDVNGDWVQEARISPGDTNVNFAGAAVAIDGDYAVIGAPRDNGNGVSAGSIFVYERNAKGSWILMQRLVPDTPEPYSYFGNSVAIIGGTIIVGAEYSDQVGSNAGAAFVFDLSNNVWSQSQILTPNDPWAWTHFGGSIDMQGGRVVIGAYGDPNSNGGAYVFQLGDNGYEQTALLLASDGSYGDRFGNSVACGTEFVVTGAPHWSGKQGCGYVYDFYSPPLRGKRTGSKRPRFAKKIQRTTGQLRSGMSFEYFGNFNEHDYFVTSSDIEYYDAHEMANVLGSLLNREASLATINSESENEFIQSISTDLLWIGLSDLENEGNFVWDNGESFDWAGWGPDEPNKNGGTEDVVVMNWEYKGGTILGWSDWKEQHRYAQALIELDGESCVGDIDWDGDVDGDDVAITIDTYGEFGGSGDANHDGAVNVNDILWLLDFWGACP